MPRVTAVLLAAGISLASATWATAQEIKPRAASPYDRLPPPEKITAEALPDGRIRLAWSAVDGAVSYKLMRSMPPEPIKSVVPPDPTATEYFDSDLRPGNTYYYQVTAINEAGVGGMKASPPPVKALDPAAYRAPDPPRNVRAVQHGGAAEISWLPSEGAVRYLLQRTSTVTNAGPTGWIPAAPVMQCCHASHSLQGLPGGSHLIFRVIAESPTGYRSDPAQSNEIIIAAGPSTDTATSSNDTTTGPGPSADTATASRTIVRPAVVPAAARVKVGKSLNLGTSPAFTNLHLQKPRWLSWDQSKATVDARGKVLGRAAGFTYIVATGLMPDGSVAFMVQQVDVKR